MWFRLSVKCLDIKEKIKTRFRKKEEEPEEVKKKPRAPITRIVTGATLEEALASGVAMAAGLNKEEKAMADRDEELKINGQMKIEDILQEWEEKQKVNANAIEKQKAEDKERLKKERREAEKRKEASRKAAEEAARKAEEEARKKAEEEAKRKEEEETDEKEREWNNSNCSYSNDSNNRNTRSSNNKRTSAETIA